MKVFFINDSTSNHNWGDRAAAIALRKMICASGARIVGAVTEDDLKFSLLYKQRDPTESLTQKIVKQFIPPLVTKARMLIDRLLPAAGSDDMIPASWDQFESAADMVLRDPHVRSSLVKMIEDADLAVIHGDGCMVGNTRIARAELFLSYLIKKRFGKPVIMVNHTADFDHPTLRAMAENVYPLFDDVVFRDPISAQRCTSLCRGRFSADTAFLFKPVPLADWLPVAQRPTYFDVWPDTACFNPAEPYLCIGGSSIFSYNGTPQELIERVAALVTHIGSIYRGQIVLTVSDIVDQAVFRPIAQQLNLPLVGLTTPVQQAVDIIGNAQAYVGGRWHPSIFALRGGTPVVPISSKTFKMQALIEMSGLASCTFDALSIDQEKERMGQQLMSYIAQGDGLRHQLKLWAEEKSKNCWDNVTYLKQFPGSATTA